MKTLPKVTNKADAYKLFAAYGICPTPQRAAIATIILRKKQHLSAEKVQQQARKQGFILSRATVYNTLNLFVKKGLLKQVTTGIKKILFDSNTTPHYHFYHEETKRLIDIPISPRKLLQHLPPTPANTSLSKIDLVIHIKSIAQSS